jgi:type IX secretion system PorP/SprF family membrane protein
MRRFFNIAVGVLFGFALEAQDMPFIHNIDQYVNNGLILNPAYAGSREALSTTMMHRSQWMGFDGAPISQVVAGHTPLKNERIGLGLMFDNLTLPSIQYNSFYFNYAYRVWIKDSRFSLGIKAGGYIFNEKFEKLNLRDNPRLDNAFNAQSGFAPNFGAGAYLYNKKYFLGLSVPFLMNATTKSNYNFDFNNYHFIFTAGYLFDFGPNFKIKPVTLVDYNKYNISYQFATHLILFRDALWLGSAIKSNRDISFMLGVQLSTALKIGYAYDYSLSDIANYSKGSHEIMIRYELKYKANVDNSFYF